jgi:predicted nucleotidyltransferase
MDVAPRSYPVDVTVRSEKPFDDAALSVRERGVVERSVSRLREMLGSDLLAVWLYGSRARGEADPTETDPDLRSDVDLLAIVDPSRDARKVGWDAHEMVEAEADAAGDSPVYYSLRVFDAEWLRDRRRIRSFFIQEVDRDKIVLHGGRLEESGLNGEAEA